MARFNDLRSRSGPARRAAKRGHPPFWAAVRKDAELVLALRGEPRELSTAPVACRAVARLCWVSDAFLGQVLYRAKARMQDLGVPVLPRLAHRLAMSSAQVCIGDPVVIAPGLYLLHGQVVLDGLVEIGPGVVIGPWVTVGLKADDFTGPTIGPNVRIGTGAKILGPISVGAGARVGANSVVVDDVAPRTTIGGIPARPIGRSDQPEVSA